jgi:acyl-CoA hydrolase
MSFHNPVHVGELLILKARVNFVGRTSMEVGVRVETENLRSGNRKRTGSAFLTFVSIDDHGHPIPATPLKLETELEQRRNEDAKRRFAERKASTQQL